MRCPSRRRAKVFRAIARSLRTAFQSCFQLCPHSFGEGVFRPDPLLCATLLGLRVLKTPPQARGLSNSVPVGLSQLFLFTSERLGARSLDTLLANKGVNCVRHPIGLSSKSPDLRTVFLVFARSTDLDFCQLTLSRSEALGRPLELRTHSS